MPDTVLLIVVIEIDIPAFKISIGQQGRKKIHNHKPEWCIHSCLTK